MLAAFTLLLLCQLAGEMAVRLLDLPVPGPVLGLAMLLAGAAFRRGLPPQVESAAGGLLRHLSLLFVPAGVGVLQHLPRIGAEWLAIAAALLLSSVATIVVTAAVMRGMIRLMKLDDQAGGEP